MRRKNLKSIIASCIKNKKDNSNRELSKFIDGAMEQVQDESNSKLKMLDIYIDQVRQTVKDRIMSINEIEYNQKIHFNNDFDNFLSPSAIKEAKQQDKQQIINITKHGKQRVMWKPPRLKLNKDV